MNEQTLRIWTRICLLNLLVVAALGMLMRYKIGFDFPYFIQKNLQHAHSHFAFAGWVTQLLMVLMLKIFPEGEKPICRRYIPILNLHLFSCYGMLFAFAMQGYAMVSISFSTLSVLLSFVYAGLFLHDSRRMDISHPSLNWFKGALLFNVLSSAGTFYLAYMMASGLVNQHAYLASVYYYLHFQYNGWFFFGIMGLFAGLLHQRTGIHFPKQVFTWFFLSCFPAYLLSVLWLPLPSWLFIPIVLASIGQLAAWIYLLIFLFRNLGSWKSVFSNTGLFLLAMVAFCITVKLGLQLGSNIPALSKLAFGFRTIVIAYLHLVLLGIITMYLIVHLLESGLISSNRRTLAAILLFAFGVYANELILGIQGIASFSYTLIPYSNHLLFGVAALMLFSLIMLLSGNLKKSQ